MMPTMPTKTRSRSSASSSGAVGPRPAPAAGRRRPACAAPRRPGASTSARIARAQRVVERHRRRRRRARACSAPSSTSGAPLVTTHARVAVLVVDARSCDISLRSEVNGISPTRSKRRSAPLGRRRSLRSATRKAASVGSPWIAQSPSPSARRSALLGQAAAAEHARSCSSRSGPSASAPPSCSTLPLRRVADAGDVARARGGHDALRPSSRSRVSVPVLSER